jgi:DNA-binding GntR family transcriptional regulator
LDPPADPVAVKLKLAGRQAAKVHRWLQDRPARPVAANETVIPVGEIAEALGLSYGTVASALIALARVGLIERLTANGVRTAA